ncbi:hypothetical protein PpBr36_02290 [Pyricularia pennisetigena]|uniref:hypothetical protein n=1 Tax=Pyricularia pennisetigena TaxID=1578925 RepID=UPI00115219DE|nr:hypothetical protein PpBr36_02290 [Pyricularia pennisetigena]TLS31092.1 hypothetical protein PpBr36_02290 [Pyricularia pennisetigena]
MVFAIIITIIALGESAPTPINVLVIRNGPEFDIIRAAVYAKLFPTIIEINIISAIIAILIVLTVIFLNKYVIRRLDNGFTIIPEKQAFTEANKEKNRYIFLDALAENFPDTVEFFHQILGVLFAGRDTTASFINWVFYNLARDPVRYLKLKSALIKTAYVVIRLFQPIDRIKNWDLKQNAKYNITAIICFGTGTKVKLHMGGAWE